MRVSTVGLLGVLPLGLALGSAPSHEDPRAVDFSRDVQPILSRSCFVCHGPDEASRQADLRLDLAEVVGGPGGIVVPGDPDASELVYRITSPHDDERMPPPDAAHPLEPDEIETLRRWVAEGAPYAPHWSFLPVEAHTPPGEGSPIDGFVRARMAAAGLDPLPEADRATLIRRLSFDLCGMPPTPAEVAAFVADDRPGAYEELVDRLLASDAHAERMALAWMDAARYGDTSVHHADGPRDMWLWRDWVIDAYRANKPFDEFTVEQLAGDLLPDPTREQLVASGFHRNTPTSDEGGAIDEELRVKYMVDRVKTTANVWLGLSMECAQCHDHKYDAITQRDYYRFFAYFNQSVEKGFQTREGNEAPLIQVPSPEQGEEREALDAELAAIGSFLAEAEPPADAFEAWCAEERTALLERDEPVLGTWYQRGPFAEADKATAYSTDHVGLVGVAEPFDPEGWTARPDDVDGTVVPLERVDNSAIYLTRSIRCEEGRPVAASLGSDDSIRVWLDGALVFENDVARGAAVGQDRAPFDLPAGESRLLIKIVNGAGDAGYAFSLEGSSLPAPVVEALSVEPDARTADQAAALRDHYVRMVWPEGVEQAARLADAEARSAALDAEIPTVMVMEDREEMRPTFVLDRGMYDAPREDEPIEPGVPEHIFPMPGGAAGAPPDRLGLARWLTDPDHPLTARVTVNRYWAMLFGRGLVPTVMDFGSQGERPSHPELLDWLARDFVEHGWDVRHTLRRIVTSEAYRRSSRVLPEHRSADPENVLLARASRFRLDGEFLRDQALAVSGLLVDRVGGPGVKPYQPEGLWNEVSLDGNLRFERDGGEALYRKSMYTYWKRSAPMPALAIFDTPIRDTCVVQRQRTNTPLQALVTLNDEQFVEAARHLAARLLTEAATFEERVDLGFLLCTAHPADARRREVVQGVLEARLAAFAADPEAATQLLAVGESPADPELDPVELASWTMVTSMLLNLDETLTRE